MATEKEDEYTLVWYGLEGDVHVRCCTKSNRPFNEEQHVRFEYADCLAAMGEPIWQKFEYKDLFEFSVHKCHVYACISSALNKHISIK